MKKILLIIVVAFIGIISTSCENDEIKVNSIGYDRMIFPEPYTVWGGSVSDAIDFMKQYGLSSTDITPGNATNADGTVERKYFKFFMGDNLYDNNASRIIYKYCFDNLDGGLRTIRVELIGHSQFKLDEITIQFKNSGYNYDGIINSEYYLFSNANTTIKCYLANCAFVFAKKGDPEIII